MIGGWEIRIFPDGDRKAEYFAPRGFLHAQLWHPLARVSVLTPSALTGGLFELFPYQGWKAPVCNPSLLRALIVETHGVSFLTVPQMEAVMEWHVRAAERRARRPAPTPSASPRQPALPRAERAEARPSTAKAKAKEATHVR